MLILCSLKCKTYLPTAKLLWCLQKTEAIRGCAMLLGGILWKKSAFTHIRIYFTGLVGKAVPSQDWRRQQQKIVSEKIRGVQSFLGLAWFFTKFICYAYSPTADKLVAERCWFYHGSRKKVDRVIQKYSGKWAYVTITNAFMHGLEVALLQQLEVS